MTGRRKPFFYEKTTPEQTVLFHNVRGIHLNHDGKVIGCNGMALTPTSYGWCVTGLTISQMAMFTDYPLPRLNMPLLHDCIVDAASTCKHIQWEVKGDGPGKCMYCGALISVTHSVDAPAADRAVCEDHYDIQPDES